MGLSPYVEQLIDECHTGERQRDCDNCPAAHWKGGTCCFGDPQKRDEDTSQCRNCLHYWECGEDIAAQEEAEAEEKRKSRRVQVKKPSRFSANPRRQPLVQIGANKGRVPQRKGPAPPPPRAARPAAPVRQVASPPQEVDEHAASAERWMKDTVWGGLHGMSQSSTWFFENYYWK